MEDKPNTRMRKVTRYRELPPEPPIEAGELALYPQSGLFPDNRESAIKYAKVVEVMKVEGEVAFVREKTKGKKKSETLPTRYGKLVRYEEYTEMEEVYDPPNYKDFEVDPDAE